MFTTGIGYGCLHCCCSRDLVSDSDGSTLKMMEKCSFLFWFQEERFRIVWILQLLDLILLGNHVGLDISWGVGVLLSFKSTFLYGYKLFKLLHPGGVVV